MDASGGGASRVRKIEEEDSKKDAKPVKTLNRVPRACNACRKQKMRCEGADNPPCRRCRNTGLECLFEKPSREATLTGEAGLERIRSLENHVADIKHHQAAISGTLSELLSYVRGQGSLQPRSPQAYGGFSQSPGMQSLSTPSASTPTMASQHVQQSGPGFPPGRHDFQNSAQPGGQPGTAEYQAQTYPQGGGPAHTSNSHTPGPVLPPFSSLQSIGPSPTARYQSADPRGQMPRFHNMPPPGSKRAASNQQSANSSDVEDDDEGLPHSGLVAPWEVLRGLADVAIEQAAKENGDASAPHSRAPSPGRHRPAKRRKTVHTKTARVLFPDVVTKKIIDEKEARTMFQIFFQGCSTFLPVFDANVDTFDAMHERSPFAVNAICMVAAMVRDGGGRRSEIYKRLLEEVQAISCATLFSPVTQIEAVQAMILVSGWSENGWLSGGHAVRMALELSLHRAWPRLCRRMNAGKSTNGQEDRDLVIASRTWFTLYLFEHQMSYGTGRPAILKDDESIWDCRRILQHPLAIEDDMRLVSTVELMAIRERVHNQLSPFDSVIDENTFNILNNADEEFRSWFATWDRVFSEKYVDAAFYRQSLQIQQLHAELFHNASALRGINGPEDVQRMPRPQRELAIKSMRVAAQALELTVSSQAYRDGLRYAVHYTHATVTFAGSFLLRLARLFPDECDRNDIRTKVERLAALLSQISGKRYALTLQLMLKRGQKRRSTSSRSPTFSREPHRPPNMVVDTNNLPQQQMNHGTKTEVFSPTYDHRQSYPHPSTHESGSQSHHLQMQPGMMMPPQQVADAEHIWQGFEQTSNEQLPVWLSDQNLGGQTFSQLGMNAFFLPQDYLPTAPQIW